MHTQSNRFLFWTCFLALIATSFGFISRAFMLGDWGESFGLSPAQQGEIFGAGLWPFAISIVVISLFVDKIGYKAGLIFALVTHLLSGVMTIFADGYQALYWAAFVGALGNGAVEAVINPVVATLYQREKTKWLNILHAGWPGGLMLAGMLTIFLDAQFEASWQLKVGVIFIPVILYGVMLFFCHFPVNERVKAGVSYRDMLREPGGLGIFIILLLVLSELARVLGDRPFPDPLILGITVALSIGYGVYTRSVGRPLYIFMLLIMLLLATTELGTDGWIKELMGPAMTSIGLDAGWILVYTSLIMTVLRFLVGPIMRITRLGPLGLLALSSALVIAGIVSLSRMDASSEGIGLAILLAATIYGAGQCFFWPTTLGYIAEQFPRGGALTLNAIAGVGMLGVGILGGPWLGYMQNKAIETELTQNEPALFESVSGETTKSLFGSYQPLDQERVEALDAAPAERIENLQQEAKSHALFQVAILPLIMCLSYLGLILWHRSRGGYKPVEL